MKYNLKKIVSSLCGVALMLGIFLGAASSPVSAAVNGIYIADATPHYAHPQTGEIEDSGGADSQALGQSMTESATYEQALVEVDPNGNTYVTVRLQLMDNIENPQFQADGTPVTATLMQEDYTNHTADFRMQVPNENSVIRCNMYVTAMGREVIFYITVANLQSGSDDFVTSVTVESNPSPASDNGASSQPAAEVPAETDTPTAVVAEEATATDLVETEVMAEPVEESSGLQEYDSEGNAVTELGTGYSDEEEGGAPVGLIIGIIAVVLIGGGAGVYFGVIRKKKEGEINEN